MMPGEEGEGEAVPACNRLKIWVSSVTLKSCCQRVVFALEQCSPSCDSFSFNLQEHRQNLSVQMVPREAKSGKRRRKKKESWGCFHCSGHLQCFHHVLLFNLVHVRHECILFFSRKMHWNPITLPFRAILLVSYIIPMPYYYTSVTSFQLSAISTQALSYCKLTVGVHSRAARKSFSYPRARRLWLVTLSSMAS